jgi:hypothetical protein
LLPRFQETLVSRPVLAAWMLAAAVAGPVVAAARTEFDLVAELEAEAERSTRSTATADVHRTATTPAPPSSGAHDAAAGLQPEPSLDDLDALDASAALLDRAQNAVRLNGFVAVEMLHDDASPGRESTFTPQLHLATRAHVAREASVFGEIEYQHGAELRVHRAFIEVHVAPWLTLRAGRFYAPISYELLNHYAPVRLTTTRPLIADIAFGEWSDAGVEASGRLRSVSWNLAIVNGPAALSEHGLSAAALRDNNDDKAIVARVSYEPFQGLETGAAGAYGHYDPRGRLAFRTVELDARLRRGPLDVWFEYQRRDGDDEPCAFAAGSECDARFTGARAGQQGAYLLAAYSVLEGRPWIQYLKPLARIELLEELHVRGRHYRTTAGLAWSPLPHVVAKAEYSRNQVRGEAGHYDALFSVTADF